MDLGFTSTLHIITRIIEGMGVMVIVVGIAIAGIGYVRRPRDLNSYQQLRATLGRAILLGLELMVAADIIYTVAVEPTWDSVAVLGVIVIIRTFLSLSLEVEISGRWPWSRRGGDETSIHGKDQPKA